MTAIKPKLDPRKLQPVSGRARMTIDFPVNVVRRPGAVEAKYNPAELRDLGGEGGGRWVASPASAAKDALKLAGKIDLAPDEKLIGSGKVDGGAGGIRTALIDRAGKRFLRLGAGGEGYGKRDRENGVQAWDGNPDSKPLTFDELDRLTAEKDTLENEYDSASPTRQAAIDARLDEIRDLQATDDLDFNGTAELDSYSMNRLVTRIGPALDEGADQEVAELESWDLLEALKAEGGADPARLAELERVVNRGGNTDPIVFTKGILPGSALGDVHFSVELDDPTVGVYLLLGVKPDWAGDDWGGDLDWQGRFDYVESRKFLGQIDQYTKGVQAAAGVDTHPGGEQLKHWWVYGPGAARWATFTELYHQLREEIEGKSDKVVKAIAASWFHLRFGYWPGDHRNVHAKFNPAEKRDPNGEWGDGIPGPGGSGSFADVADIEGRPESA